jgi:hypothetical protein
MSHFIITYHESLSELDEFRQKIRTAIAAGDIDPGWTPGNSHLNATPEDLDNAANDYVQEWLQSNECLFVTADGMGADVTDARMFNSREEAQSYIDTELADSPGTALVAEVTQYRVSLPPEGT